MEYSAPTYNLDTKEWSDTDFETTFPELSAFATLSKEAYNKLKGN